MNNINIDKNQFKLWIDALESDKYPQSRSTMQSNEGYCCLGVGCKVLIPNNQLLMEISTSRIRGAYPNSQPAAPQWLKDINNEFLVRENIMLSSLNDEHGLTFKEIAKKLKETFPEVL